MSQPLADEREEEIMTRIPFSEMQKEFERVLLKVGLAPDRAALCARILAENSLDGVASHGVNRFVDFIEQIRLGYVKVDVEPARLTSFGAWEQWDGKLGVGPLNALTCTERALELAREYGLGCVGLRNTNHWMRGGAYGWQAAEAGFGFMGWTNTKPNMPAWGARDSQVGNNPLILAVPRQNGAVVLDMAMTQFSYGRLETAQRNNEILPIPGGFDIQGNLTRDPNAIIKSERALPIGYWKGSGLALLLDLMGTLMSGGQATYQIGQQETEYGVSQVFIAFDVTRPCGSALVDQIVDGVIDDLHKATPIEDAGTVLYPGERALRTRQENLANGIPVDPSIWQQILAL
jgi:3-dehydro-L-gulonate 2-dehydrogenase